MPDDPSNPRDFAGLYRATLAPLRRYLRRLLGNATDAEDVAHDAYLRVYPKVKDQTATIPEAVLYTTAHRLAINRLKRRSITPISSSEPSVHSASAEPGVVQQVMARQELQQLESAIAQLPEGCRAVLLLRKIELMSHQEIAQRLAITVSTVEKQHARALRLLHLALLPMQAQGAPAQSDAADKESRL
jgi:RNA polymerase sigma-70 factor (ECF subfamily)